MVTINDLLKLVLGTKLTWTWWGERRRVEDSVRQTMASAVEADADSITAGKRLYNTRIEVNGRRPLLDLVSLRGRVREYWERETLPHPDPGVRLLPREKAPAFDQRMNEYREELAAHTLAVQEARPAILADARERLKGAFNEGNYPADLSQLFKFEVSYPSLTAPGDLPPQLYEQEKARVQAKLEEAVKLTQEAFTAEFAKLVANLHERLEPGPDGRVKVFKSSTLTNLTEFFERFRGLNVCGLSDLEKLVAEAKQLVSGVQPAELRTGEQLRQDLAQGLARLETKLSPLIVNAPRRKILRPSANGQSNGHTNGVPKQQEPVPV